MNYLNKDERPWGRFFVLQDEVNYKIKKIEVNPGQRLSYQFHNKRSETWIIIEGRAFITIDDNSKEYKKGDTIIIPLKSKHRVENKNNSLLVFIEIQTGTYFGEDDIIRLKDDYGRK
ncbi:MAG: phosphomannose isomerase type II C-terminal cupin domain [Flavobacteriaceae bacterium]|nr:phosphomannose isomerase type II C-terminal cupin domain [Flavobacteriaceae bacterium]